MTEAEWLMCADPKAMLDFLASSYRHLSARKLRLFAVYCCQNVLQPETQPEVRRAVELGEQFAEGLITADVFQTARIPVFDIFWFASLCSDYSAGAVVSLTEDGIERPLLAAFGASVSAIDIGFRAGIGTPMQLAALHAKWLRDIFPSPYRPKHVTRDWFVGNDRTAEALARGIYDDRAFNRLPILADALQEAGCENEDILAHCREPGEHVRGCWVVDLVLGKN